MENPGRIAPAFLLAQARDPRGRSAAPELRRPLGAHAMLGGERAVVVRGDVEHESDQRFRPRLERLLARAEQVQVCTADASVTEGDQLRIRRGAGERDRKSTRL